MASPEDKQKHRKRIRSHITKDLHSVKYRQRVKEDKKAKELRVRKAVKDMTHRDFVEAIQELDKENNGNKDG